MDRILIGRLTATVGAVAALAGSFAPWLRSGARDRNSYEILSLVDRLGFSPSGPVGWGLRLWPVVPLLLAAAVALHWFPRAWATGVVCSMAVVYIAAVSGAVLAAPSGSLVSIERGPLVTLCGATILAVGAGLTTVLRRLSNRQ